MDVSFLLSNFAITRFCVFAITIIAQSNDTVNDFHCFCFAVLRTKRKLVFFAFSLDFVATHGIIEDNTLEAVEVEYEDNL